MDIASEVAQYLDDNGFGTVGTDIHVGMTPAEQNGIFIDRLGGSLNNYVPVNDVTLAVYVKDTSASDAITTIEGVKNFMHRMVDTSTSSAYMFAILALGEVESLGRDLENAIIYKLTISVKYRDTSIIS